MPTLCPALPFASVPIHYSRILRKNGRGSDDFIVQYHASVAMGRTYLFNELWLFSLTLLQIFAMVTTLSSLAKFSEIPEAGAQRTDNRQIQVWQSCGLWRRVQVPVSKAGLQFTVGHIHRLLKKGNYTQRVSAGAPEYLAAEILELAGNTALDNKKHCIMPRYLQLTV
ncbi:histone-fold-containing protein [Mycena galopus ATCC 62051]|nr:histone-fold-containing protein [Mycena galopus ATCC 62051]